MYLIHIYIVETARVCTDIKAPNFKNFIKSILHPAFPAAPTATTFVAEASIEIFPPKHDPNESAHQKA